MSLLKFFAISSLFLVTMQFQAFVPMLLQAHAEDSPKAEWKVCHDDVEKYCKKVPVGHGRILKCLHHQQKKDPQSLSPACNERVQKAAAKIKEKLSERTKK